MGSKTGIIASYCVLLLPLSACAAVNKFMEPPAFQRQIAAESEASRLRNQEYGRIAHARSMFLISCGAMDPLDRAEVELYHAYMDAKYGKAKTVEPKVSQRCQDYRNNKITLDQAAAMGKGPDEQ